MCRHRLPPPPSSTNPTAALLPWLPSFTLKPTISAAAGVQHRRAPLIMHHASSGAVLTRGPSFTDSFQIQSASSIQPCHPNLKIPTYNVDIAPPISSLSSPTSINIRGLTPASSRPTPATTPPSEKVGEGRTATVEDQTLTVTVGWGNAEVAEESECNHVIP